MEQKKLKKLSKKALLCTPITNVVPNLSATSPVTRRAFVILVKL